MNLEPYSKKGQGCPPIDHLGFHMVPRRTSKKHALEIPMPHFSEQWGVQTPGFLVCFLVSFRQQQHTIRHAGYMWALLPHSSRLHGPCLSPSSMHVELVDLAIHVAVEICGNLWVGLCYVLHCFAIPTFLQASKKQKGHLARLSLFTVYPLVLQRGTRIPF